MNDTVNDYTKDPNVSRWVLAINKKGVYSPYSERMDIARSGTPKRAFLLFGVLLVLLLAGCGGGDSTPQNPFDQPDKTVGPTQCPDDTDNCK